MSLADAGQKEYVKQIAIKIIANIGNESYVFSHVVANSALLLGMLDKCDFEIIALQNDGYLLIPDSAIDDFEEHGLSETNRNLIIKNYKKDKNELDKWIKNPVLKK